MELMLNENNYVEVYDLMVKQIASEYSRRYQMVDKQDITQEIWMWFVTHPRKYKEWSALENQKDADKLIAQSLRNAALGFCEKEKATIEGYNREDVFYYSKDFIKLLIPAVLSDDWTKIDNALSATGRSSKSLAESGDWMAHAADIRKAFDKLDEKEQNLVFLFYGQDLDSHTLHDLVNDERPSARATAMAANRAITKMVKLLGGYAPKTDNDYQEVSDDMQ